MNKREINIIELEGEAYKCKSCKTHLALATDIVSRAFHTSRGQAYLFHTVMNINVGDHEKRMMISGMHTVADISCCCCGQILGWKYEAVDHETQKYKEGKFVLERVSITDGVDSELNANAHSATSETKDA
ncbi:protein yippee-like At5g53940 [Henckelia pumila]|uniref:protein yippee-like At5g53940 n=1 Tax=Henckelia pumila TaxID=405737 RepID=UPI003C6E66FD